MINLSKFIQNSINYGCIVMMPLLRKMEMVKKSPFGEAFPIFKKEKK
jgi:hypothetical protein